MWIKILILTSLCDTTELTHVGRYRSRARMSKKTIVRGVFIIGNLFEYFFKGLYMGNDSVEHSLLQ